jgi:hypothetical protein
VISAPVFLDVTVIGTFIRGVGSIVAALAMGSQEDKTISKTSRIFR